MLLFLHYFYLSQRSRELVAHSGHRYGIQGGIIGLGAYEVDYDDDD